MKKIIEKPLNKYQLWDKAVTDFDITTIKAMVNGGFDYNVHLYHNCAVSALHYLCGCTSETTKSISCVKFLLKQPLIDINNDRSSKSSAIFDAIDEGNIKTIELLLNHDKLDINKIDVRVSYNTVLQCLIENGDIDLVKKVLGHKDIDINCNIDKNGESLLHLASENDNIPIFKFLLEQKEITVSRSEGEDFVSNALDNEDISFFKYLINHPKIPLEGLDDGGERLIIELIQKYYIDNWAEMFPYIKALIECKRYDLDKRDRNGDSPIGCAYELKKQRNAVVNLLLKHGADAIDLL